MALIPYAHVPGDKDREKDPPLQIAGHDLLEMYCGDSQCDCVTGHIGIAGHVMAVDLGTARIDFADGKNIPAREPLRQALSAVLRQGGGIERMRAHYAQTREYGKGHHHEYLDWTKVRSGETVGWDQLERGEMPRVWPLIKRPTGEQPEEAAPEVLIQIALRDAYCIEPRCDCQRVVCSVIGADPGQNQARFLGTVAYAFKSAELQVVRVAPGTDPDRLFVMVDAVLKGNPGVAGEFAERYRKIRAILAPILARQRRENTENKPASTTPGRNDPCPCKSGKKFKKCHGA